MAQWFMEHNLEKLYTPDEKPAQLWRPSWMLQPSE